MKTTERSFFCDHSMKDQRIVFMGTPEFAVASLDVLIKEGFKIVGVVTVPDKPAGRGQKIQQSAVKIFADQHNIPTLQPLKLRDPEFVDALSSLNGDLFVVVAFRMLPDLIWKMPKMGTINLHGSLLPKYRGAAPIHWALVNGEKETGVTTFFINENIDTGDVIERTIISIDKDETTGELHDRMMHIGAQTLSHTVALILEGKAKAQMQLDTEATHAPKLSREIAKIDWQQNTKNIHDFVRGMSPYPCAWTLFRDKPLKIFLGKGEESNSNVEFGKYEELADGQLRYRTLDGWYYPKSVQWEGKKRMNIEDFMRGMR